MLRILGPKRVIEPSISNPLWNFGSECCITTIVNVWIFPILQAKKILFYPKSPFEISSDIFQIFIKQIFKNVYIQWKSVLQKFKGETIRNTIYHARVYIMSTRSFFLDFMLLNNNYTDLKCNQSLINTGKLLHIFNWRNFH